jgi:hypothetical protein
MKKLLLIAAVAALSFTTSHAQGVSFGAKAGANFASVNGDDVDDVDGRTSLQVGGVANIGISELFAVQPEVVYSAQGFSVTEDGIEGTGKLDYINIPVLADFTIAEGFSLQGGPQVGILVTDDFEVEGQTESLDAESVDIAAAIGAQYRLPIGLFFQARYTIGLSDIISDVDAKNAVFGVAAGWFFN